MPPVSAQQAAPPFSSRLPNYESIGSPGRKKRCEATNEKGDDEAANEKPDDEALIGEGDDEAVPEIGDDPAPVELGEDGEDERLSGPAGNGESPHRARFETKKGPGTRSRALGIRPISIHRGNRLVR